MVDEYQVEYEYSAGNTVQIKSNDLKVDVRRPQLWVDMMVDGTIVTTDTGASQMVFSGTAYIDGDTMDTLHGVQTGAITYSGAYPRLKTLYWDGDSTETNIEVAMTRCEVLDQGAGWWLISFEFVEKDQ